jgi:hypothetical protein
MDARAAETILRKAALGDGPVNQSWEAKVERLSQLCEDGTSKTHIAFLGTSMLAKALDARADLRAIKPRLASGNDNAYSARSLCHGVLVPLSAELGFSIGVSGREPLNNQPYFRMTRLGDDTPVHAGGRAAFDFMVRLVDELQGLGSDAAREALRAFIAVRRRYQRTYEMAEAAGAITPDALIVAVQRLVSTDSEGGRRAQAAVAGLLDVFAGTGRVQSGRINDPSRHYRGDVAVLASETAEGGMHAYEKAFEVRDKPVRFSDVALFGRTCVDRGVREAAMVLVSEAQPAIDHDEVRRWSERLGVSMTIFLGWGAFAEACLFWASPPQPEAAVHAVETIRKRLIEVEASRDAVAAWDSLTRLS